MDQRVCRIIQLLRDQELPPPGNLHAINYKLSQQAKHRKSLEELARQVDLSESRLRALFKSNLGLPPKKCVKKMKMDAAAKMLANTFMKVKEIAAVLNINDDSHFVRDFKLAHGNDPDRIPKALSAAIR